MTTFEQRTRDAKGILDNYWPRTMPKLPDAWRDMVAEVMVIYATQCERALMYELDNKLIECPVCGGTGFSTSGTNYDAVCSECGGQKMIRKEKEK